MHNIFDHHAHYDDRKFNKDRNRVLDELPSKGVRAVVNAAADLPSCKTSIALAEKYNYIYATVGVHPHEAKTVPDNLEQVLEDYVKSCNKVKAIGEIGLDYYYDHSPREKQQEVFERQLKLANKLDLPVVVHNRDATEDTMRILLEHKPRGVVHSYSGSVETAQELKKLDFYFGFTGVLTFKNAKKALEAVEIIPMDRLLLETDCPYMAPVPLRGERSDSSMIIHIVKIMADIKGVEPQEMLDITFANACRFYNIDEALL